MSIEDDIALLQGVPLLALLGREPLRILAIGAETRYLRPRDVLFRQGDSADGGYVVQEGTIRLVPEKAVERESIVGPGALIGELALFTETRRPLTATATEPSMVLRIARPLFLKMLDGYPDLAVRLRDALADRAARMVGELGFARSMLRQDFDEPA